MSPRAVPRGPRDGLLSMDTLILCADPGVPLYGPSGASAHLRGVARALARRGPSRLAVARLEDRRGRVDDPVGLPVVTAEPRRWGWLPRRLRDRGELLDGRRLVRRALHLGTPALLWERHSLLSDGGARSGLPRVVEINAPLARERARYGTLRDPAWAARVERRTLQRADRVVAVSAWLADWAVRQGCAPDRVRHVPNGVEARRGDRERARARLGLAGLVVGFLGSLRPWHGVERLGELLDRLPEATALVVGDGPTRLPEHPRLRALGRVPPARVADVVAAMDVGLAPYRSDAPPWFCPLKVLEYRAQGVPVVGAAVGDVPALVRGGGEVVAGDDLGVWAAAVRRQAEAPRVSRVRSWDEVVGEALAGLG